MLTVARYYSLLLAGWLRFLAVCRFSAVDGLDEGGTCWGLFGAAIAPHKCPVNLFDASLIQGGNKFVLTGIFQL